MPPKVQTVLIALVPVLALLAHQLQVLPGIPPWAVTLAGILGVLATALEPSLSDARNRVAASRGFVRLHLLPTIVLLAAATLSTWSVMFGSGCTAAQGAAVAQDVSSLLPLACDLVTVADPAAGVVCAILDANGAVIGQLVPRVSSAADAQALVAKFPSTPASRAALAKRVTR